MATRSRRSRSARRRNRRYIGTLVLFVALFGGWSWLWHYAAGQAEIAIDGWRAREAKAGRVYTCGSQTHRRLSVPHRGELRQGLRAVPQQPAAGRDQDQRHADRRADLSAEFADQRIPRPAHHRRSGTSADHHRQLEARPVERARHAGGAGTRVAGVRRPGGRPHQRRRRGENLLHAKHIEIHGRIVEGSADQPSGDRDRAAADAGVGAQPCIRRRRSRSTPTSPRCCAG